ncbi:hypothetical protein TNCV_2330751 [Trichonephila clavipes]|nr:hypothetical protein TNCV_2330751 [Trichonephila clavipes]
MKMVNSVLLASYLQRVKGQFARFTVVSLSSLISCAIFSQSLLHHGQGEPPVRHIFSRDLPDSVCPFSESDNLLGIHYVITRLLLLLRNFKQSDRIQNFNFHQLF